MLNSSVLDVILGLIFVYLVLSILCTALNEGIAQFLGLRPENMYATLHGLFPGLDAHRIIEDLLKQPLIASLSRKNHHSPSTIPSDVFSSALMELLGVPEPPKDQTQVDLMVVFEKPKYDDETLAVLQPLLNAANNNLDQARKNIEAWYDQAMGRASDWYKRRAQTMTFIVAVCLVIALNADTILVMDRLWASPTQRAQIEALAKAQNGSSSVSQAAENASLSLMGWSTPKNSEADEDDAAKPYDRATVPTTLPQAGAKALGLILTVFAILLGAPFWFDKLSMVMNIRAGSKTTDPADPNKASGPQRLASSDKK